MLKSIPIRPRKSVAKAVPIRPDVTFSCDLEREMIDYLICRVKIHSESYGEPPNAIAIVTQSDKGRIGHSFSMKPEQDRLGTCSAAAAILLERAAKKD